MAVLQDVAQADIGPPCALGSHRDSYALGAASTLAQKLGFSSGANDIHPLFSDANCVALGNDAANQASSSDHCKQSFTEARDHGQQSDGNHGDGSVCANLGYEAGMAILRSKARSHSGPSGCSNAYDQGVSAQCTGSTSFGASNNIESVCYQTGSWDASEKPDLCANRNSSTSNLSAKPGETTIGAPTTTLGPATGVPDPRH